MNRTSPSRRRLLVAGLLLFVLGIAPALVAQSASGTLTGVVTDAAGLYLQGASVRVEGSDRVAVTDRLGRFRLDGVPAGAQQVVVDYLGREPAREVVAVAESGTTEHRFVLRSDVVVLEEFRVESIREGQSRAINQQRTANTIKNIVSADTIGNLPDRTVGEALGRLPGVNVVDDSYASIRGTAAEFNAVTLDGDRFTTAGDSVESTQTQGDNRAVDLSLIPAELVGGIEVIKALTADLDADSFGGTINLVTRSAFELEERSINGKFEYILNDFGDRDGFAGSLTFMDVLDKARTLGLSATFTYRNEERLSNSYEMSYHDADNIPIGTSGSGTGGSLPAVGEQGVEEFDTRLNFEERTSFGATVNLDWKVSERTELRFRTFYEDTEREGGRFRFRARALSRWDADSTAAQQSGRQMRIVNLREDGVREQDVLRLGIEGTTGFDNGKLTYGLRHGESTLSADRERYIFDLRSNTERRRYAWSLDRSDPKLPILAITHLPTGQDGFFTDLKDRSLSSLRFTAGEDNEEDLTANLDYAFASSAGGRTVDWKVGAKHRGKERTSRPGISDFSPTGTIPDFASFPVDAEPRDLLEGRMPTLGPFVSLPAVIDTLRGNPAGYVAASGDEIVRLEARKYDVNEDIVAAYAMASSKFGELEVIAGLRWEQTETGYRWLADPAGPSSGERRYDDFYPSLLLNYRVNDRFVVRAAYTNSLSRPSYGDLIPYRVLADTQEESGTGGVAPDDFPETRKVFLGNANLDAQKSENYDLSLEYYLQPAGLFSAALFRKDLSDVIFRSQFKVPSEPDTIFFQDRNGSSGKVEGLELSWQQAFTFLPGPLDGLGINLNATFINGSSVLEELVPGTTDTSRALEVDFLPEQPETVYNVQLWWEKYGFTARVAMNHIDEFVRTSGGRTSFSVNDKATRWDASLSYRLNRNFTLYVEGKNLTEEVQSWYATTPGRPEDYTFTGTTYTAGVKFRF